MAKTKKLNSFILSDDTINRMRNKIEESRRKDIETGFSLCREINKNILKIGNECKGTDCMIRRPLQRCQGSDMYEGLYHTHPKENARPSTADSYGMYLDGLGCIGSAINDNINCFIRKNSEMDQRILDELEYDHYWMGFHANELTEQEYEDELQNIADKHFKKIEII